ncbi:hypothetical protein B9M81_23795 [Mycobacteroides abscessus]|nr:hypothetical protein A3O04_23855 [Mycobacteroides abscessus]ARQ66851.1 hypothetical protein CAK77_24025 [Mycobacteroides abscessus subsp. massiliense]ANO16518.1 hypothetical protein BAB77_23695 [Mycobacteroides abscessus]ORA87903.1 hypothetical protein BST32_18505 [Mycobacteroides abscessus subsp. massiliense]OTR00495.1 hypothetical protein B9M83_24720 [Mycobacteroides abscessus]
MQDATHPHIEAGIQDRSPSLTTFYWRRNDTRNGWQPFGDQAVRLEHPNALNCTFAMKINKLPRHTEALSK